MRPLLLDLFCCAGGAALGYHQAGFHVVGVDHQPQPNYPFEFILGDALEVLARVGRDFDVVHASPPCQANIAITAGNRARPGWTDSHVNLVPPTRVLLEDLRRRHETPYVLEQGVTRELRRDVQLCGLSFGLPTFRHRRFELGGWACAEPTHPSHRGRRTAGWRHGVYTSPDVPGAVFGVYGDGGGKPTIAQAQCALGVVHTADRRELNEAIPPAYTRFLGRRLLAFLASRDGSPRRETRRDAGEE